MDDARVISEIEALVVRRCRALDDQDWHAYAACHTEDVVSYAIASESGVEEPVVGIGAVLDFLNSSLTGWTTRHEVSDPRIELTSATTATGRWAMTDRLEHPDGRWIAGAGEYQETYDRVTGEWLVASRRLVRTRLDRGRLHN